MLGIGLDQCVENAGLGLAFARTEARSRNAGKQKIGGRGSNHIALPSNSDCIISSDDTNKDTITKAALLARPNNERFRRLPSPDRQLDGAGGLRCGYGGHQRP